MKTKHLITLSAIWLLAINSKCLAQAHILPGKARALCFVTNNGQVKDQSGRCRKDIHYRLQVSSSFNIFIGAGLVQYQWCSPAGREAAAGYNMQRLDVQLLGANKQARAVTSEKAVYFERYYLHGCNTIADAWEKITYRDIYPGIDWVIYLKDDVAEYDFIVHPGGDVANIKVQYSGALALKKNGSGGIDATTPAGMVTEQQPKATGEDGRPVPVSFTLNDNIVGFRTGPYTGTLTIDPVLQWGTYIGGALNDVVNSVSCDKYGNVYLAGSTASTGNIATTGAFQTAYGGGTGSLAYVGDAYLARFNAQGAPVWITYYGGAAADQGWSVACDTAGHVYLSGFTSSTSNISTAGAQQAVIGGSSDAFLVRFDTAGVRQWGTYFGGTGAENKPTSVSCAPDGSIFLAGITASSAGIATAGASQATYGGGNDAFLARYNSNGQLQWATYFGGSGAENDYPQCLADRRGNVYLSGLTASSTGIATAAAFQAAGGGGTDGFLAKFSAAGARQWSTYYGGSAYDRINALAIDDSGYLYTLGTTLSPSGIATAGTFQTALTGTLDHGFLAKWDSTGNRMWGTYIGGGGTGAATSTVQASVCMGANGGIYVTGSTNATTGLATPGALKDTLTGSYDIILARFTAAGQRVWATYYGGVDGENNAQLAADRLGHIYMGGTTSSGQGIATAGAYRSANAGGYQDGFLASISDCDTIGQPGPILSPAAICKYGSYTFSVAPVPGAQSYSWQLPAGWSGSSVTNSITVFAGADTGTIRVSGVSACTSGPQRALPLRFTVQAGMRPTGRQGMCQGDSIILQANTGAGYAYQWLKNGVPLNGATDSLYTATSPGHYSLITSSAGCSDTAGNDTVIVHPLPAPAISWTNGMLHTGAYVSWQWFYNGNPLAGAVNASFAPVVNGSYSVRVTDSNGCTALSAPYVLNSLSARNPDNIPVRIYPNPARQVLYVATTRSVLITVSGPEGRLLLQKDNARELALTSLPPGIYIVRLYDEQHRLLTTEKLVRQ